METDATTLFATVEVSKEPKDTGIAGLARVATDADKGTAISL